MNEEDFLLHAVYNALLASKEYGLETEVVTYALLKLSKGDKEKAANAIIEGLDEWVK